MVKKVLRRRSKAMVRIYWTEDRGFIEMDEKCFEGMADIKADNSRLEVNINISRDGCENKVICDRLGVNNMNVNKKGAEG
jgi:hypothetical protein